MFRLPNFIRWLTEHEWVAILLGAVSLGLLLAWLQKHFQLNPRVVRFVLLAGAGLLLLWFVLLMVAYAKELRREEEEWAGRDEDDGD